jgi:hypothetical protein
LKVAKPKLTSPLIVARHVCSTLRTKEDQWRK